MGWSDPSPQNRTSKILAQELHTLLQRASIPAPYLLAGASLGGMSVRMYASLYPTEVAGMVLVDSIYPHQEKRLSAKINQAYASFFRQVDMLGLTMPIGVPRLLGLCETDTPELRSMARAVKCRRQFFREVHEERARFGEDSDQVQTTAPLGNMPLVVLSHDPEKLWPLLPGDLAIEFNKAWEPMQQDLTRLSTNSSRVIAKGSSHEIQIDNPDVVIEAIQKLVGQFRSAKQSQPAFHS